MPVIYPFSTINSNDPEWAVVFCGDWAPFGEQAQAVSRNSAQYYGDLLPVIQDANLAVLNLEGVISAGKPGALVPILKDGISLCFPAEVIQGLTAAPFKLACLANNHSMDYGIEGLQETQAILTQHGIHSIGAGKTQAEAMQAAYYTFGSARVAILNVAEGEEARAVNGGAGVAPFDFASLREQLQTLRAESDVRIVVAHAGREHLPVPAPYLRGWYRALVEAGATLVIGHHPHMPQGFEIYQGAPVAYSLGNFALYIAKSLPYHTLGYFLKARFQGRELKAVELWPYRIEADHLALLKGEEMERFQRDFHDLSSLITEGDRLERLWEAYADQWLALSGLNELTEGLAQIGQGRQMLQAVFKEAQLRLSGKRLDQRLLRKLLHFIIRRLERDLPMDFNQRFNAPQVGRGAAVLRNRFDTAAHRELYLLALERVMNHQIGSAPAWAYQQLEKWFQGVKIINGPTTAAPTNVTRSTP